MDITVSVNGGFMKTTREKDKEEKERYCRDTVETEGLKKKRSNSHSPSQQAASAVAEHKTL